ncbi:DUF6913 domain-containing protein [Dysgonomonas capnocytophagoides]|uniref:DUF6913 domain-containing protein n=1 Tax=Dysgonomonas capnocytophagoides TaxID=45254 RepID=UPI003341A426
MFEYFIQKSIESELKNNKREHQFLNFDKIKNVLILFDIKDWEEVQSVAADLQGAGKSVSAWTVLPKISKGEIFGITLPEWVKTVDLNKDLSWMKAIRSGVFTEFGNEKYDTLIDLSAEKDNYLLSLLVRNKSRFCIGTSEVKYKVYDFVLYRENDKTLTEVYEQLKIYLAQMR